jgi:hypothetical protein
MAYESVWHGRESITSSLERDYAAMWGDDWDLIWVPTSPMTTPWENAAAYAQPDPDAFVKTTIARKARRPRRAASIDKDWTCTYTGAIHHVGRQKGRA